MGTHLGRRKLGFCFQNLLLHLLAVHDLKGEEVAVVTDREEELVIVARCYLGDVAIVVVMDTQRPVLVHAQDVLLPLHGLDADVTIRQANYQQLTVPTEMERFLHEQSPLEQVWPFRYLWKNDTFRLITASL